jgi:cytochrome b6-f complex iron-sulfur subunit
VKSKVAPGSDTGQNFVPIAGLADGNPISRRRFLGFGIVAMAGLSGVGALGSGLWRAAKQLPGRVNVARLTRTSTELRATPVLYDEDPRHSFFVTEYPVSALPRAERVYPEPILASMRAGVVVMSRRCPHLGQELRWCESSQFFQCVSHGASFNSVGEYRDGPAPRGMTIISSDVDPDTGQVTVRPDVTFAGAARGTDTTRQEQDGDRC